MKWNAVWGCSRRRRWWRDGASASVVVVRGWRAGEIVQEDSGSRGGGGCRRWAIWRDCARRWWFTQRRQVDREAVTVGVRGGSCRVWRLQSGLVRKREKKRLGLGFVLGRR